MAGRGPTIIFYPHRGDGDRRVAEAMTDFAAAHTAEDLWRRMQAHMAGLGFEGLLYGTAAVRSTLSATLLLSNFSSDYLNDKTANGLEMEADFFFHSMRREVDPLLWDRTDLVEGLSGEEQRSLEVDWDHGVTTGVSIPISFRNGLGGGGIGCHVPGMTWAEFDRLWNDHGATVMTIVSAFDERLRAGPIRDWFPLSEIERDCLSWLACGLAPKQIAIRLDKTDKAVQRHIANARRTLGAASVPQAIATALVYGLVTP